jgi:hypothetical protein
MLRSLVRFIVVCLAVAVCATTALVFAQTKGKRPVRRAEPPQIEPRPELFFPDAFAEALSGSRPANLSQPAAVAANGSSTSPAPAVGAPAASDASPSASGWSAIISGATIEDAIKAFKLQVDADVTTPSHYAGKGFKAARRDFSMLAMLFAIAGEYDGEVRWKKDAPAARDVLARTAANSKVGSQQVFNEAKLRKQELQDLVGGQSPFGGKEAEVKANWANVCDRPPLMQHLELIFEPRVKAAVASESAFKSNLDKLLHDAEIIAAIGAVLAKEGMMDADSDEYKAFCEVLKTSGREIVEACKNKNYEAAGAAVSAIGKSCNDCHESYRSN